MYFDRDASIDHLAGETVAVIGYGIQGHAFANNLRDSGVLLVVGNRDDDYAKSALADGFTTLSIGEAIAGASIVLLLVPDEAHQRIYEEEIALRLRMGGLLVLAHGFSIRYELIKPREDMDVALLAPKMFGKPIRERFQAGLGVPAFIDVVRTPSGRALERTLAIAKAMGFTRYGVMPVPLATETELDLFQEQFLTPLLIDACRMAFEILIEAGYDPHASLLDMYASGEMAEMLTEAATTGLYEVIEQQGSPTCRLGVQRYLGTLIGNEVRTKGREILEQIRDGRFVAELKAEASIDYPSLDIYRTMYEDSLVTRTHQTLRNAFTRR